MAVDLVSIASQVGANFLAAGEAAADQVGPALVVVASGVYLAGRVARMFLRRQGRDAHVEFGYQSVGKGKGRLFMEVVPFDLAKGRLLSSPFEGLAARFGLLRQSGPFVVAPGVVEGVEAMFMGLGVLDFQQAGWDPEHPDLRSVEDGPGFVGPRMPPWVRDGFPEDPGEEGDLFGDADPDAGDL